MKVRAKLKCVNKFVDASGNTQIRLDAIYAEKDGTRAKENMAFSDATPNANLVMTISKGKPAADAFVTGQDYYLDFLPVASDTPIVISDIDLQTVCTVPPRVTPARIEEVILNTEFYVFPGTTVTVCLLTLKNGAKVIGHNYGAIDAARQDWATGRFEARAVAIEKVWELEGYSLRERLAAPVETD